MKKKVKSKQVTTGIDFLRAYQILANAYVRSKAKEGRDNLKRSSE